MITKKFGLNSLRYFASKVWNTVPLEIKDSGSVEIFKIKIWNWEPKDCYCYLRMVTYRSYPNFIYWILYINKSALFFYFLSKNNTDFQSEDAKTLQFVTQFHFINQIYNELANLILNLTLFLISFFNLTCNVTSNQYGSSVQDNFEYYF